MNPGIATYRPHGKPATASVTVIGVPTSAKTVTINGTVYTFGTDFDGDGAYKIAMALTDAINASRVRFHNKTNPIVDIYAVCYGNIVSLFAALPGTAGNSYTLSTDDSTCFTVSGATFSGGAAGVSQAATVADGANVVEGSTTDAAVATDTTGTISGKLRGIVKLLAACIDLVNGWMKTDAGVGVSAAVGDGIASNAALFTTRTGTNSSAPGAMYLFGYNGATWDRLRSDTTNGLDVDVTRLPAGEIHIGEVGSPLAVPSANFTRPADTTAYASGDLVANSTTAGSVTPLSWTAARVAAGSFMIRRVRLKKSTTSVTSSNFRLHLYTTSPTVTNGDNGAWLSIEAGYLGALDINVDKAFSDAARGNGAPNTGSEINVKLSSGQTIYGLLEARGAYTPGNAEVFTVELELMQN